MSRQHDKRLGKAPAYQVYAGLDLGDSKLQFMSLAANGLIFRMKCWMFLNGEMREDPSFVARAISADEREVRSNFQAACDYFERSASGALLCDEIERQRKNKEEERRAKSAAAGITNEKRWSKNTASGSPSNRSATRSATRSPIRSGVEKSGEEMSGAEAKGDCREKSCTAQEYPAAKGDFEEWVEDYKAEQRKERVGRGG